MEQVVTIPLNKTVREGDPILRFDLMTGDQLFVDRMSYHFIRPRVGQGFVFRTDHIPEIDKQDYYIKRLVGVPGDVMEIRAPALYRNGRLITGARAFELEASQTAPYTGYTYGDTLPNGTYLARGRTLTVPAGAFFAMGDNSSNSADGRVWGFVPAKDAVGHPLFIYYPFTRRWGVARSPALPPPCPLPDRLPFHHLPQVDGDVSAARGGRAAGPRGQSPAVFALGRRQILPGAAGCRCRSFPNGGCSRWSGSSLPKAGGAQRCCASFCADWPPAARRHGLTSGKICWGRPLPAFTRVPSAVIRRSSSTPCGAGPPRRRPGSFGGSTVTGTAPPRTLTICTNTAATGG